MCFRWFKNYLLFFANQTKRHKLNRFVPRELYMLLHWRIVACRMRMSRRSGRTSIFDSSIQFCLRFLVIPQHVFWIVRNFPVQQKLSPPSTFKFGLVFMSSVIAKLTRGLKQGGQVKQRVVCVLVCFIKSTLEKFVVYLHSNNS